MRTVPRLVITSLLAAGGAVLPTAVGVTPAAAVSTACGVDDTPTVSALQSPNFYIDRDRDLLFAQYAGYSIDAGTSDRAGYWIELDDFDGDAVTLSTGEAAAHRIPTFAAGETATQYFLLKAAGATPAPQTHTIRLYDAPPAYGAVVCETTFTYNQVVDTIAAKANKVTSVATDVTTTATIGDEVTVTVNGSTGTLGAGPAFDPGALNYTPTAVTSFPAASWHLVRTELTISPDGSAAPQTYVDQLRLDSPASGPNRDYTARYTFEAVAPVADPSIVVPIQYIASGTQIKHTTLSGTYPSLPPVSSVLDVTIAKSVSPDFIPDETPAIVDYTVVVSNDDDQAISLDDVVDTLPDGATYTTDSLELDGTPVTPVSTSPLVVAGPIDIASGGSITITYTVDLGTAITGARVNSVVGHVGNVIVDASNDVLDQTPASAAVLVQDPVPAVAITKTAGEVTDVAADGVDGRADAGDTITYTYDVDNTGRTDLHDIAVTDDKIADADISCGTSETDLVDDNVVAAIALGGATVTCEGTYTITQADIDAGEITNIGTATGYSPVDEEVTHSETVTKTLTADPALDVAKSGELDLTVVAPDDRVDAGDTATYTYEITNDGNVTIEDVSLTDNRVADAAVFCGTTETDLVDDNLIDVMAPGDSRTCTADYTVAQDDIDAGYVTNLATVAGTDVTPDANEVEGSGTETLELVADPELTVVKTADRASVSLVGQVITYTIGVTNSGNVTLSDVTVADAKLSALTCTPSEGVTGPIPDGEVTPVIENGSYIVPPGESVECTGTYVSTVADFVTDTIANTATATGVAPGEDVAGEWEGTANVAIDPLVATIGGRVYVDRNGNRKYDTGDMPLVGVGVHVVLVTPRVLTPDSLGDPLLPTYDETVLTGAGGVYAAYDIPAGLYSVTVPRVPGVKKVTDYDGGTDWIAAPDVPSLTPAVSGGRTSVNFVGEGVGTIKGRIYQPTDDIGFPYSSVQCTWAGPDGVEETDDDVTLTTKAGTNGAFTFTKVPYGHYDCAGLTPTGEASLPTSTTVTSPTAVWAPLPLPTIPETGSNALGLLRLAGMLLGAGLALALTSTRRFRRAAR
ncbi:MAG: DUF7507 domain-containing protein [Ilumatobacteraceae bacterium]